MISSTPYSPFSSEKSPICDIKRRTWGVVDGACSHPTEGIAYISFPFFVLIRILALPAALDEIRRSNKIATKMLISPLYL